MFGGRKMNVMARRKERIYIRPPSLVAEADGVGTERLLASYGVPPAREGNRLDLVVDGADAYRRVVRLIEEARSTIHITTYILGRDEGSRALIERLRRRASEGVAVRLLIDDVGSWRLRRRVLAPLIEAGAQVAFFMPVLHVPFRGRANLRNHRKLILVDHRIALTGGMNLAWPYMGPPTATHSLARHRGGRRGAGGRRPRGRLRVGLEIRHGYRAGYRGRPRSTRTSLHPPTRP